MVLIVFLVALYRMILKYLIPVKLSIGILPHAQLLENYNLNEVYPVSES